MKKTLTFLLIAVFIGGYFIFLKKPLIQANSFQECVDAGNPVLESYPQQCIHDGKSFTRDIGNALEVENEIFTDSPRSGDKISSPLTISGQARGTWYSEASFPIKLVDSKGNVVAESFIMVDGE